MRIRSSLIKTNTLEEHRQITRLCSLPKQIPSRLLRCAVAEMTAKKQLTPGLTGKLLKRILKPVKCEKFMAELAVRSSWPVRSFAPELESKPAVRSDCASPTRNESLSESPDADDWIEFSFLANFDSKQKDYEKLDSSLILREFFAKKTALPVGLNRPPPGSSRKDHHRPYYPVDFGKH